MPEMNDLLEQNKKQITLFLFDEENTNLRRMLGSSAGDDTE